MPKRIPIKIGDLQFNSKKECKLYVKKIIENLGCVDVKHGSVYFNLFIEMLNNHPKKTDKIGKGIKHFMICKNYIGNGYELKIKRIDESIVSFSWVSCCTNNFKNINKYDIFNAMRYSIKKNIENETCQNCKKSNNDINICYCFDTSFKTIASNFLNLNKNYLDLQLVKHKLTNIAMFNKNNIKYEKKWINFHNKNIKFKLLCNNCILCPSCKLFIKYGKKCVYCIKFSKNKQIRKTKEHRTIKYIEKKLPNYNWIYDGKSIGNICHKNDINEKNGHLYPDLRIEFTFYNLIIEIDEFQHRGASYKCDEQRMYNIVANMGLPCIFIRYNPDNNKSNGPKLIETIKKYLDLDINDVNNRPWDDYLGFKVEYLFYKNKY